MPQLLLYDVCSAAKRMQVGDVIYLDGKRYKVIRKGSTAAVIRRHYWFDVIADRATGALRGHSPPKHTVFVG